MSRVGLGPDRLPRRMEGHSPGSTGNLGLGSLLKKGWFTTDVFFLF